MIFSAWYKTGLLAYEASEVIYLRLWRMDSDGWDAVEEGALMVGEKISAACEASGSIATGGSIPSVVERYREHVAANAGRLKCHARRCGNVALD